MPRPSNAPPRDSTIRLPPGTKQPRRGAIARCCTGTIIDPRTNKCIAYWDLVTTVALIFTALVTPVEVAFLQAPSLDARWSDNLFLSNRAIDVVFIIDMLLQFRIAYSSSSDSMDGKHWVMDGWSIARNYGCSYWFALDLFSVSTSAFDLLGDEGASELKALRAVRTLRLVKLVKLARGSRIFKRWEMHFSINYSYLTLTSICVGILLSCHWVACIWGLQATFDPLKSWLAVKEYCVPWGHTDKTAVVLMLVNGSCPENWVCSIGECSNELCSGGFACVDAYNMYTYSLYFAVMTITSVGYGDIAATAFNATEQLVLVTIMLLTGMLWGYLIGIFCTMAALSPTAQAFRDDLSDLNSFMAQHNVAPEMRFRLREYMHQTVSLLRNDSHRALLAKLSPSMQGEVSLLVNEWTMEQVWYLAGAEVGLLIHLASKLEQLIFPPLEFCPSGFMYILQRGKVLYRGQTIHPAGGKYVWGEDVLLDDTSLELDFPAIAMVYTSAFIINGKALNAAIDQFPTTAVFLNRLRRRWRLRRAIVRHAEELCGIQGVPFRGRLYPIYAKTLAVQMRLQRHQEQAGPRHRGSHCGAQPSLGACATASKALTTQSLTPRSVAPCPLPHKEGKTQRSKPVHSENMKVVQPSHTERLEAAAQYGMQMRVHQMTRKQGSGARGENATGAAAPTAPEGAVLAQVMSALSQLQDDVSLLLGTTPNLAPHAARASSSNVYGTSLVDPMPPGGKLQQQALHAAVADSVRAIIPSLAAEVARQMSVQRAGRRARLRSEHTKDGPPGRSGGGGDPPGRVEQSFKSSVEQQGTSLQLGRRIAHRRQRVAAVEAASTCCVGDRQHECLQNGQQESQSVACAAASVQATNNIAPDFALDA